VDVSNPTTSGTIDPLVYELMLSELLAAGYPPEKFSAERVGDALAIKLTFGSGVDMRRELLRTIAAYMYYIFSDLSGARGCTPEPFKSVAVEVRQEGSDLAEKIEVDPRNHVVYYILGYVAGLALKRGLYLGKFSAQIVNDELRMSISMKELKALRRELRESRAKTWRYLALSLYTSPICSTVRSCGLKLVLLVWGGFRRSAALICV